MKIIELLNNIKITITNEEADLLGKFYNNLTIGKKELNLREQIVANNLVNKSILKRKKYEGKIFFQKTIN